MLREIPVADIRDAWLDRPTGKICVGPQFVSTVGQAFRDIGFVFVRVSALTEKLPQRLRAIGLAV